MVCLHHVMGQAKFGGLCSDGSRVAIVEDVPPTYSLIQIIAHELAHTLGAGHDGGKPFHKIAGMVKQNCSDFDRALDGLPILVSRSKTTDTFRSLLLI
uniref:Putative metalloprotease n=1 Tax=Ixodes ricinus TaxID=34613 RepID=A0A0K8R5Y7_IXORI